MIYAELAGGLGNQMFIYAFARGISLQTGEPATLLDRQDWKTGAPAHTAVALQSLAPSPAVAIVQQPGLAKRRLPLQNALKTLMIKREQQGGMLARDWHGFECRMAPALNRLGLHFATDGFVPCRRGRWPGDMLAWGYFQSEEYFAGYAPAIKAELTPPPALLAADPQTEKLAAEIAAAQNSICLHLRRGDYQAPGNAILQVCTPAYYRNAVAAAASACPGGKLFVFSDDLAWAKANLQPGGLPVVFAEGARPAAAELALMCRCRHFIISNSTFSWWAQYLGSGAEKQVFAPTHWYTIPKTCDLYAPTWQLVEG
ncbi:MAG: alpha-1,2-fucosyltransferase [Gemmiger sp.]|nr:alpha-1,2-fucosyltransferase [Gemmiger sp.]